MKLNKAIKKEKNNNKSFFIFMIFLLIVLPFTYYLFQRKSGILFIYLILLEVLIIIAIFNRLNNYYLKYEIKNNIIKIKDGIFNNSVLIYSEKIKIIHTIKKGSSMEIVIITPNKSRNRYLKILDFRFLRKNSSVNEIYNKNKKIYEDEDYYYQTIKSGYLKKYNLLDEIYRNCVKAEYTKEAIENIKIARGQEEL